MKGPRSIPPKESFDMLALVIPIATLLISVSLLLLGNGLLNTVLVLRARLEGFDEMAIGLIMSCYFLGYLLGTLAAPPMIRRIGHIRAFAFCAAVLSCITLAYLLLPDLLPWMLLRVVTGMALVSIFTIIESWLNGGTPPESRGRVFALYMMVNLFALALAQQLLHFGSPMGFELFAVAAILVTAALMPMTWTRMVPPLVQDAAPIRATTLFRRSPVGMAGALLSGLTMGAFWGMAPMFAADLGFDQSGVATLLSFAIIGGAVFQIPLGKYSDSHDRRKVLAAVALLAGISSTLLGGAGLTLEGSPYWLWLSAFFYGGFSFAIYPIAIAHMVDTLDADEVVGGSSSFLMVHGVGSMLGPTIAGALMGVWGVIGLPLLFVVCQLLLASLSLRSLRRRDKAVSVEEQGHFVPMMRTSPTVLELHPDQAETTDEAETGDTDPADTEPAEAADTPDADGNQARPAAL